MLTYLKGDMFKSPAQVLVNTVNTVGVMGKGVALEFKKQYPDMFKAYERACNDKLLDIGKLMLWKGSNKWILLFPTKKHWRNPSKIEYIEAGLQKFIETYAEKGITSISFPRLGCGNGGLDWADVQPLMERYLKKLPISVFIYIGPYGDQKPEHLAQAPMEQWLHSNPQNIGFTIIEEDLQKQFSSRTQLQLDDGTIGYAQWVGDGIWIKNGIETNLTAKELCEFWIYIRDNGVICIEDLPESHIKHAPILLKVLQKLNYLQPIVTSHDGIDFKKGYQYIKT